MVYKTCFLPIKRTISNADVAAKMPEIEVKPVLEDENDGDEDWNALVPNPANAAVKETMKKIEDCHLITLTEKISGRMEISNHFLYFYDVSDKSGDFDEQTYDFKWSLRSG